MKIRVEHKVILLSLMGGISLWFVDSILDYIFSPGESFSKIFLTDINPHELYSRIFFFIAFIVFGLLVSRLVGRLKRVEHEKENFIMAVANSNNGIALTDENDQYVFVNEAYADLHGYAPQELIGKTCLDLIPPGMVQQSQEVLNNVLRNPDSGIFNSEIVAMRKDGSTLPIEIRAKSFWDEAGNYQGHTCIVHDISEEKKTKEKLEQNARFLSTIFDSIRDPFIILDRDYKIIKANQAYSELKGIVLDELIEEKCYAVTRKRDSICDDCIVAKTFRSGDPAAKEKKVLTLFGTEEWVEIYTYPIVSREGIVTHVVEYVRNITARKRAEQESHRFIKELETLSSEDSLTGLQNRRMIFERIRHEIERVRRYKAELSLIFCDLDYFKEINDTYGHKAGDVVLKTIADVLRGSVRTSDVVGRYGGDEFLLVLPQTSLKGAQELAERIRISVQDTKFEMPDGKSVGTTMSIGVAFYDGTETDVDALISRIDTALYVSKRSGKNQVYSLV
ncbi:MAG: sensor domain-containing diguanylate cyclase [Nitrospirae bacterium]|nr:sensor domain-containing diguanylate cyclase [Nitrospirota bacterium]